MFHHSFPLIMIVEEKDNVHAKTVKEDLTFWSANQQQKYAVSFVVNSETVKSIIFVSCLDIFLFTDVKPVSLTDTKSKHIKVPFSTRSKIGKSSTMLARKRYQHCNFKFCHLL